MSFIPKTIVLRHTYYTILETYMNFQVGLTLILVLGFFDCQYTQTATQGVSKYSAKPYEEYRTVQAVRWRAFGKNIEARFEEIESLERAAELRVPLTRLIVSDLDSGEHLFAQTGDDHGSLIQRSNFFVDGKPTFISVWSGGSHDLLEIYTIENDKVIKRMSEPFRDIFVPVLTLPSGKTEILLLDNSATDNRLVMKKFTLRDGKYASDGEIPIRVWEAALRKL